MITVENIIWEGNPGMDGWYEIYVKNFNKREPYNQVSKSNSFLH
jgi:hypothetical protein